MVVTTLKDSLAFASWLLAVLGLPAAFFWLAALLEIAALSSLGALV
jgi:hypothetical protein